jgi:YfiH family protein
VATGRSGGVSLPPYDSLNLARHVGDDPAAVQQNLDRVAASVGAHAWAALDAVHGADVAIVTGPGVIPNVDAMVTSTPGLALVAMGADCVTIGLSAGASVAVVHCGWTGLVVGVVPAAVEALRAHAGATDVTAVIGPSVCGSCYPVPRDRADRVLDECEAGTQAVVTAANGEPGIDVAAGVVGLLGSCDVSVVWHDSRCTVEDADLFSYRRDGRTGRQGLAVCLLASDGRGHRDTRP